MKSGSKSSYYDKTFCTALARERYIQNQKNRLANTNSVVVEDSFVVDVSYTVKHWQQNVNGGNEANTSNYTLVNTEVLYGMLNGTAIPSVKYYAGFTSPTTQTVEIARDGSTVVNYYYTRNSYTVTIEKGKGIASVAGAGTYKYGATVTISSSVNAGYTFEKWTGPYQTETEDYTFTMSAFNLTETATAKANTNTVYTVKHWQENINGEYTLKDTDTLQGTTDTKVTPGVKTYTGFKSPGRKTINISGDGSAVVNYYYTRNSYSVTLSKGTGIATVAGAGTYKYGATVTISATPASGYNWSNWTGTYSTTSQTYTFSMPASNVTNTANGVTAAQYLYYSGKEYTDVTGGWIASKAMDYSAEASQSGSLSKYSTYMVASIYGIAKEQQAGGKIIAKNKIDVTNYKKLYFDCSYSETDPQGKLNAIIGLFPSDIAPYSGTVASYKISGSTGRRTYEIDISGVTGSYYVGVYMGWRNRSGFSASTTIYRVWME